MIPSFIVEAMAAKEEKHGVPMPKAPKVMAGGVEIGEVQVPDGKSGKWYIETFKISDPEARRYNIFSRWDGGRGPDMTVYPGTYKRLVQEKPFDGLMMSNTHMERYTNRAAVAGATGRVLINGLGLGMVLTAILKKKDVQHVRVVEIEPDVIKLVAPTFSHDKRVEIVQADAIQRKFDKNEKYDFAWHDIWPTINGDQNGRQARTMQLRARGKVVTQDVWARLYWN